jgi:hypothetical protein
MNWTPEQVKQVEQRIQADIASDNPAIRRQTRADIIVPAPAAIKRHMNRWEELFGDELELRKSIGVIEWYDYEPMRLKLAAFSANGKPRTIWYTPDFVSRDRTGAVVCWEVKGFWREAARVRIKLAASRFPFQFMAVTRSQAQWSYEVFAQLLAGAEQ